jgi:hypothetical protein
MGRGQRQNGERQIFVLPHCLIARVDCQHTHVLPLLLLLLLPSLGGSVHVSPLLCVRLQRAPIGAWCDNMLAASAAAAFYLQVA